MTVADERAAMGKRPTGGATAWVLTLIDRIEPQPVKGQLGLFEVPMRIRGRGRGGRGGHCLAVAAGRLDLGDGPAPPRRRRRRPWSSPRGRPRGPIIPRPLTVAQQLAAGGADACPLVAHRDPDGIPHPLVERDVETVAACALALRAFLTKHAAIFKADDTFTPVCESCFDDGSVIFATGHTDKDGNSIAGQREPTLETTNVAAIDPQTLDVERVFVHPAMDGFVAATTAIRIADELWLGSYRGDRLAYLPGVSRAWLGAVTGRRASRSTRPTPPGRGGMRIPAAAPIPGVGPSRRPVRASGPGFR